MTFLENLQQTIDRVTRETLELIMEFNSNSEEMKKLIERNNEISYLISMTFLENPQETIDRVTREALRLIMEFNNNSEEMKKLIERNNEISYLISKNEASVIELNEYVKRFSTEIQIAGSFEGNEDE